MSETPTDPPGEILFDREALQRFLELFHVKIENAKGKKEEMQKQLKVQEMTIASLELKYGILAKYSVFLENDGFAAVEKTVNDHIKNIEQAQQDRLQEPEQSDETSKTCMMIYEFQGIMLHCYKIKNHSGPHGVSQ